MPKGSPKLFCFSPQVMLATFIIEVALAAIALWRYKLTPLTRVVVLTLLLLATFQLAEYGVCEGLVGLDSLAWARLGFVAITLLPPLGLHIAYELAGATSRPILPWAYTFAALFIAIFTFANWGSSAQACLGNYVLFSQLPVDGWLYTVYYYGLLLVGMWQSWQLAKHKAYKTRGALLGLITGYLAFIVPTTIVNIVDPNTITGIPSIMCGFAVLLALVLVGWVLPLKAERR